MTVFAYVIAAVLFGSWAWADWRQRHQRDEWWQSWHQARTWHVVPELYDWQEHGL